MFFNAASIIKACINHIKEDFLLSFDTESIKTCQDHLWCLVVRCQNLHMDAVGEIRDVGVGHFYRDGGGSCLVVKKDSRISVHRSQVPGSTFIAGKGLC